VRDFRRSTRLLAALALLLVAGAAYQGRRHFIRTFFGDGEALVPGGRRGAAVAGPPGEVDRLRVVLLDGLGAAHAAGLPVLQGFCSRGQELRVDVGFPTVSLPVQHVLWTGRTQRESGVLYRIPALGEPPVDALPALVSSQAIAESHPAIVHSFGFGSAQPPLDRDAPDALPEGWRDGFAERATEAIHSDARLVFVHLLRIDEAGHAEGGASEAYAAAAAEADAILGTLLRADVERSAAGSTRWLVLADHGHRSAGGHGGAEPEIRQVRACVVGDGVLEGTSEEPLDVHLSDVARFVGESLGVGPSPGSSGRPWPEVLAGEGPSPSLPTPSSGRWIGALLSVGGVFAGLAWINRRLLWAALLWPILAYVGVLGGIGAVTLSNPAVYPPLGAAVLTAAWPGWLALVSTLLVLRRRAPVIDAALAVFGGVLAWALAALILAGAAGGDPPLTPLWTAQASLWLILTWPAAIVAALWLCLPTSSRRQANHRSMSFWT